MDNKLIKAILKINPNAEVSISEEDIDKITWENGTTPIPIADIQAQIPIVEAEIKQEEENAETKKTSAKQKLKDLGLNDDEIQALLGV